MTTNALKAISTTPDELRVGNYIAIFGGRDLEGEYFTKATRFDSAYTDSGTVAVDWEHGFAPTGEPAKDDVLGRVDWKTARLDDKGLFVERVLNRRNRYVQYIEQLIADGLIGTSSEAIPDGVQKAKDGRIESWPIRRDTLTVSPMEPRMLTQNTLTALKGLAPILPALNSYIIDADEADKAAPEAGGNPAADADARKRRLSLELTILELENI